MKIIVYKKIMVILKLCMVLVIFLSFFSLNFVFAQPPPCNAGQIEVAGDCVSSTTPIDWQNISDHCPAGTILWLGHCVDASTPIDFSNTSGQSFTDTNTTYTFLAPFSDQYKIFNVKDGSCPFGRYLNMMITIFIGIAAVLAMIMIIVGGIEYMTSELVSSKEAGREKITHAVLGLLLALAAFLILNTVNPSILKSCLKVDLIDINVPIGVDEPQKPVNGLLCANPAYAVDTKWDNLVGSNITPLPEGVTVNHPGDCQTVGQHGCTSTRGLDPSVLKETVKNCKNVDNPSWWKYAIPVWGQTVTVGQLLLSTYTATDCDIVLSGGTECWEHDPAGGHRIGSSTVDLRHSTSLDNFILKRGKVVYTNKLGEPTYNVKGINYFQEGDRGSQTAHWHVFK